MSIATQHNRGRAIVVGGSLGGLFAGLMLRNVGWDVDIFERSRQDLQSRGGGIVLQAEVVEAFKRAGLDPAGPVGVVAKERIFLDAAGNVTRAVPQPQTQTSWGAIYRAMRSVFPSERYHAGAVLEGVEQNDAEVIARFTNGRTERGAMLVAADGASSQVRRILLPETRQAYAGYVAWRGLVPENQLDASAETVLRDRFAFYEFAQSHMLNYPVAGEELSTAVGDRRFNWVWYRNVDEQAELPRILTGRDGRRRETGVPPGLLASEVEAELHREAARLLPPPFRKLVAATREPFVQAIVDLAVSRMAFGRVALLGDAAFVPRPHTAASTAKAAANALALADTFELFGPDVSAVLSRWEPAQLRLGEHLRAHGQLLGDRSQFPGGRRQSAGGSGVVSLTLAGGRRA